MDKKTLEAVMKWALEKNVGVETPANSLKDDLINWIINQIDDINIDIHNQAAVLCQSGQKLQAIKFLHENMGWGLKECYDYCNKHFRRGIDNKNQL